MIDGNEIDARLTAVEAQVVELQQQLTANIRANVSLFRAMLETMQKIAAVSPDAHIQAISVSLTRMLAEMPEV